MSLPAAWVDSLFNRLTVRYGAAFMRQYEGIDPALVRADWADVLAGFDGDSIAYALRYLSADRPPTALQFREQCRRAPAPNVPRIGVSAGDPTPEQRDRLAHVGQALASRRPSLEWAYRLQERDKRGDRLTITQRQMYREALAKVQGAEHEPAV